MVISVLRVYLLLCSELIEWQHDPPECLVIRNWLELLESQAGTFHAVAEIGPHLLTEPANDVDF